MTDVRRETFVCSKCGEPTAARRRLCRTHHAEYMREWRKTHPMSAEQAARDTARSYAGVYLRRGKIVRQPCRKCGSPDAQMHHPDYSKPVQVVWLCRPCHLALHENPDPAFELNNLAPLL